MVFYNPFTTELGSIPTIVYPARGAEEVFDRHDKGCIERYLQGLWDLHRGLVSPATEYMIGMVWSEFTNKMTDLWTHRNSPGYGFDGFGPLIDVKTFREFGHYIPDQTREDVWEGSSSGNTVGVVWLEVQQRIAAGEGKLKEFLSGPRPELPARLRVGEDFYSEGKRSSA